MNSLRATIALLVVLVPGFASSAHAEGRCSMAATAGAWAFTYSGTILLPNGAAIPVASVGRFTQKGGSLSGTETRSLAGQSADETLTGSYAVNADCTATYSFEIFESGTLVRRSTVNVIYDDDQRSVRGIFSSASLADGTPLATVITVDARKIF
jgi:hypothetical protein